MTTNYLIVDHLSLKDIIRIFDKISIDPLIQFNGIPCWNWTGTIFKTTGYSRIGWGYRHTETLHRITYAWLVGPLPKRIKGEKTSQLDHLCRNKLCCNPVHLELVPPRINILRGTAPTAKNAQKTHCPLGHPYDEANTIWDTLTNRSCRICRQEKAQRAKLTYSSEKQREYHERHLAKIGIEARRIQQRKAYLKRKLRRSSGLDR